MALQSIEMEGATSPGLRTQSVVEREELDALVVRVGKERDRAAFANLFDFFAPRLKTFLQRQGAEEALAEDLVQETMLTLWRRADSFDPAQASASTWVFTIARNKRIDRYRRESRPDLDPYEPLLQPDQVAPDDALTQKEQGRRVKRAIAGLPPEQAELVRMAYYGDKVQRAIAEETGVALGTVKSRLRLAMKRLRRALDDED